MTLKRWPPAMRVLLVLGLAALAVGLHASTSAITLQSSAPSATLGQSVTLTASVTPTTATGKVTFYDGVGILGISTLAGGHASLTTVLLLVGAHSLRAYYAGDTNNSASTSATVSQTVTANLQSGFQTGVGYRVGLGANYVALADFNGDGKADVAVANYLDNTISIFLGNGDGTFRAASPATYNVGNGPVTMAVTDLNRDGDADIITANFGDGTISVLFGKGDGTLGTAVTHQTNQPNGGPYSVKVADVNGDGIPDVLVSNSNLNTVTLLLGVGNGTMESPVQITVGQLPNYIAVADLNEDGIPDLVTGNQGGGNTSNTLTIRLGNGNGTFQVAQSLTISGLPQEIAVADLNGDGHADLVVAGFDGNTNAGSVSVFLGNGNGTFQTATTYQTGSQPYSVAIGDINGDGKLDLVVANYLSNNFSVLLGNGNGTFQSAVNYNLPGAESFGVADINGDGISDLLVADYNATAGELYVLLGIPPVPDLDITLSHVTLSQGQSVLYSITVGNIGTLATTGAVTVTEDPPLGLIITAMSGTGWTCTLSSLSCTRSDALAASTSYPDINVTAGVANNAQTTLINSVSVSGGGETNTANDTATDTATVTAASLVYAGSGAAPPGGTANFPVVLSLPGGVSVTGITFTVAVTAVSGPALTAGALTFTPGTATGTPAPGQSNVTASTITLTYSGISPALTGFWDLGSVALAIPSTATQGQSYAVSVSVLSETASGTVGAGLNTTLFAALTYLVSDVFPYTDDVAGAFGDGQINTLDLIATLRAVTNLSKPPVCSDRFDAMDSYPVDTANTRGGGDGLNTLDLIETLKRVTKLDTTRPTRTVRGQACAVQQLQAVPAPHRAQGFFEAIPLGDRTAIYLQATADLALSGLAVSIAAGRESGGGNRLDRVGESRGGNRLEGVRESGGGSETTVQLTFHAVSDPPSLTDSGLPGILTMAWLSGWQAQAGDRVLLGYVYGSGSQAVRFLGVSANSSAGQEVFLTTGSNRAPR